MIIRFYAKNTSSYYFDDLSITTRRTITTENFDIIQADDYYPYGLAIQGNMLTNDEEDEANNFLYQGKEWQSQLALNLYDFHARQYDPATGRFLGVDPKADKFAAWSVYAGMGNNPMMMVDPDGQEPITAILVGIIKLAAKGAAIGGAAYTAQIGFSEGGFDNWNWNDFGNSLAMGAVSGVATAGIGSAFGDIGKLGHELGRATAHGLSNVAVNAAFGNDVNFGTFAVGAGGSLAGSGMKAAGFSKFETTAASAVLAGGIAEASGGDFFRGAGASVTVSLLNHYGEKGISHIKDKAMIRRIEKNGFDGVKLNKNAHKKVVEAMRLAKLYNKGDLPQLNEMFPDGMRIQDLFDFSTATESAGWKITGGNYGNRYWWGDKDRIHIQLHGNSFKVGDVVVKNELKIEMFDNVYDWRESRIGYIHYSSAYQNRWYYASDFIKYGNF